MSPPPDYRVKTQKQVAQFFRVGTRGIRHWKRQWEAEGHRWGTDEGYPLDEILAWLRRGPWARTAAETPPPAESSGPDPLERYRLARAELVETEVARTRGQLLPLDTIKEIFARIALHLRRAGERLERMHGKRAGQILRDALHRAHGELIRNLADDGDGTDDDDTTGN